MRALITIILYLLLSRNCFAQDASFSIVHDAMRRWQDTGKLIYLREELSYSYSQEVLMKGRLSGGDQETRMNKLLLTKADKTNIQEKIDRARSVRWNDSLFGNSKGILRDTLQAIISDKTKGWSYFHQYFGKGYFQFSYPLIIRNGSFALLTLTHIVGNSAGHNLLFVYKKGKTGWKRYIMMPLGAW